MKTLNYSSVSEFVNVVNNAKSELNETFKSPFIVINLLNKAAKGDFAKVKNCSDLDISSIKEVANALRAIHGKKDAFDFDYLIESGVCEKNLDGKLCALRLVKQIPTYSNRLVDIIPNKGYKAFVPVNVTINAIFNLFVKAAKVEIKKVEKAAKAAKASENKELKAAKSKLNNIVRDYNNGKLSEFEFCEKAKAQKAIIAELEKAA